MAVPNYTTGTEIGILRESIYEPDYLMYSPERLAGFLDDLLERNGVHVKQVISVDTSVIKKYDMPYVLMTVFYQREVERRRNVDPNSFFVEALDRKNGLHLGYFSQGYNVYPDSQFAMAYQPDTMIAYNRYKLQGADHNQAPTLFGIVSHQEFTERLEKQYIVYYERYGTRYMETYAVLSDLNTAGYAECPDRKTATRMTFEQASKVARRIAVSRKGAITNIRVEKE